MATKQTNRKRKAVKPVHQELTSFVVPEANLLHKEDQVVEEKQSYAMVTGLLQVLVQMQSPGIKTPLADFFIEHIGGQHCLPTVRHVYCKLLQSVS